MRLSLKRFGELATVSRNNGGNVAYRGLFGLLLISHILIAIVWAAAFLAIPNGFAQWLAGLFGACLVAGTTLWLSHQWLKQHVDQLRRTVESLAGERPVSLDHRRQWPEFYAILERLVEFGQRTSARLQNLERKNDEQAAVLASMSDGVLAVDSDEVIISLNDSAAALLETPVQSALGRRLQEVIRNSELRHLMLQTLERGDPVEGDVMLGRDRSRVLRLHGTALRRSGRPPVGAVVVLNDVTHIRQLENLRRDFVANVSHELKTPITSIKGFVETLLDGALHHADDAERFLRIIAQQTDRLNAIIEDLLSLSKIEEGEESAEIELVLSDVGAVTVSAADECRYLAQEKGIDVQLTIEDTCQARINAPLFEQALINLLDNAIKYSEPGGSVQVNCKCGSGEVVVDVVDHGSGIPAEHVNRLFERFYRVDKGRSRKLGGTGLGLAIVKHIVQAHHGRVTVKSEPGQGSVFSVRIPIG